MRAHAMIGWMGLVVSTLAGAAQNVPTIAARASPSVVHLKAEQIPDLPDLTRTQARLHRKFEQEPGVVALAAPSIHTGSGFVWHAPSGGLFVITNAHVVGKTTRLTAVLNDGQQMDADVVGSDELTDVAVVRLHGNAPPALPTAPAGSLRPGDAVIALGSPLNFEHSVTTGRVSGLHRTRIDASHPMTPYIQTDVPTNPGSSGGPLLDEQGRVVGINTSILTSGAQGGFMGISLAIPIDRVEQVANVLLEHGRLFPGHLGMSGQSLNQPLSGAFPGFPPHAVVIESIEPDSPARGLLEVGDVITAVDGKAIQGWSDLAWKVMVRGPGAPITLTVQRGTQVRSMTLNTAGKTPRANILADTADFPAELAVVPLDEAMGKRAGVKGGAGVVVLLSDSARQAGLLVGDWLLSVNGLPASTDDQLQRALAAQHPARLFVYRRGQRAFMALP